MLKDKIEKRRPGIITYGITPPKMDNTPEKIQEITARHIERLKKISVDGLIIYDIQDEAERTDQERPFPFLPTIDPGVYAGQYLKELAMPMIVYRCVGKYSAQELTEWMTSGGSKDVFSVFVGAASSRQKVTMKLDDAYALARRAGNNFFLGGVTIPERHMKHHDEHQRIIDKAGRGCRFFVSQAVYNTEASKNFLSDYYYSCRQGEIPMVPVLFTLTPCGSLKTLEFMKWLGINVPRWLENELVHSKDILDTSIELLKKQFRELLDFAGPKGIPVGCNIESVSVRKVEIDASIQLVGEIREIMAEAKG